MTTLTITARGQVTFRKQLLQHLGIQPGQKIQIELLPGGKATLSAAQPDQPISAFLGLLAGKSPKHATLDEINHAASDAWSGDR